MNKLIFLILVLSFSCSSLDERPADGIYDYRIEFAEFVEGAMTEQCQIHFKGDSVFVINVGDSFLGVPGDTLEAGKLVKHKSGRWIILHNKNDINIDEIGGCTGGPTVIDITNKIYWMC